MEREAMAYSESRIRWLAIVLAISASTGWAAVAQANVSVGSGPVALSGLGDGRGYEMVSPSDKGSYEVNTAEESAVVASVDGASVDYPAIGAFGGAGSNPLLNLYLASRSSSGWMTTPLLPKSHIPPFTFGENVFEFTLPNHLSQPIYESDQPLTVGEPTGELNLFLRQADGESYVLLTPNAPPASQSAADILSVLGASSDLSHIIFTATADLTSDAPVPPAEAAHTILYEWIEGRLLLVGRLPDNTVAPLSTKAASTGNPISLNGSRVFFTTIGGPEREQLYMREGETSTTHVSVSKRATLDPAGPQPVAFRGATPDGGKVFFTTASELTDASRTGTEDNSSDLYEYDTTTGQLADLSVDTNPVDAETGAAVDGVLGYSNDGAYAYFVANGELIPGAGTDGQPNLYLWHEGTLKFIATLSSEDSLDWDARSSARVTPDGKDLAFATIMPLTKTYGNTDSGTGLPDAEIYEYAAEGEALTCISCDPSGARPIGGASLTRTELDGYVPRALSADGSRLFFNSPDPLVPGSDNGHMKVFEYESGVIHRISSGEGHGNDFFADASADGSNVFFTTDSQLTSQDHDTLIDLYDARTGASAALAPIATAACDGDSCQSAPSLGPSFGAPASMTLFGTGEAMVQEPHRQWKPATTKHHSRTRAKRRHKEVKRHRRGKTSRQRARGSNSSRKGGR